MKSSLAYLLLPLTKQAATPVYIQRPAAFALAAAPKAATSGMAGLRFFHESVYAERHFFRFLNAAFCKNRLNFDLFQ